MPLRAQYLVMFWLIMFFVVVGVVVLLGGAGDPYVLLPCIALYIWWLTVIRKMAIRIGWVKPDEEATKKG